MNHATWMPPEDNSTADDWYVSDTICNNDPCRFLFVIFMVAAENYCARMQIDFDPSAWRLQYALRLSEDWPMLHDFTLTAWDTCIALADQLYCGQYLDPFMRAN